MPTFDDSMILVFRQLVPIRYMNADTHGANTHAAHPKALALHWFNSFDLNHDGSITFDEFKIALEHLNFFLSDGELCTLIDRYDVQQQDYQINWREFIQLLDDSGQFDANLGLDDVLGEVVRCLKSLLSTVNVPTRELPRVSAVTKDGEPPVLTVEDDNSSARMFYRYFYICTYMNGT